MPKNNKPLPKLTFEEDLYIYTEIDTIFNCSLQEAAKNILALEERLKKENKRVIDNPDMYSEFKIKISSYQDDYPEIHLYGVRVETDEAYKVRMEKYAKAEAARAEGAKKRKDTIEKNLEAKELAELERLTKKYMNNGTNK
jgi:hypothetical protein